MQSERTQRVYSRNKLKLVKSGKRLRLPGIFQQEVITGRSYTASGLAKKLHIATKQALDAITHGMIVAEGSRAGSKTRWRIPVKQAHRMAKLAKADNDRLWKNGTHVTGIIRRLRKPNARDFMRPTTLTWLMDAFKCSDAAVRVALVLRAVSGFTMQDNKDHAEERFIIGPAQLARACRIPQSSVENGIRELLKAGLIHRTLRGREPSLFRVLDAAPDKKSPVAPI